MVTLSESVLDLQWLPYHNSSKPVLRKFPENTSSLSVIPCLSTTSQVHKVSMHIQFQETSSICTQLALVNIWTSAPLFCLQPVVVTYMLTNVFQDPKLRQSDS